MGTVQKSRPPATYSREEERRRHRRRARRHTVLRLVTLVLIVGAGFLLWKNWEVCAPDKLWARFQDSMNDAVGGFPVDISGTDVSFLAPVGNHCVTVSDSHLIFYNSSGAETRRVPCTYAKTLLRTAGKYVLAAESGGKRLLLTTRSATVTELTVELPILAVSLNERGQFAVLTEGPQGYVAQVTIYDRAGKVLYTRSRRQMATEVAISADGRRVALISPIATDGVLDTTVEVFSVTSAQAEAVRTATAKNTLLYRLAFLKDGTLAAVGGNGALLIGERTPEPFTYAPDGCSVLGYAAGTDGIALAVRDYGETDGGRVVSMTGAGDVRCTVDFTGTLRGLTADGGEYLLLTDSRAQLIRDTGAGAGADVEADSQMAVLCGNTAVVLGLNALKAYPLS